MDLSEHQPYSDSLITKQQESPQLYHEGKQKQSTQKNYKTQFLLRSQKQKTHQVDELFQYHMTHDTRNVNKKIYILYTSGSAGADENLHIYDGFLREKMMSNSYLCDYKMTMENRDSHKLISPLLQNGCRVEYQIQSMPLIKSSINSSIKDVITIANKLKQNYEKHDAFIILTGFDLMPFIATLLSFMLENLKKCVIFTGGNFPISFMRNDLINNIIESFCIISLSKGLNDVLIVCKNKGYRANRSIKVKESQMDTIKSPNMHSLASVDIKIRFKVHLFLPIPVEPFSVFCDVSEKIHVIKFHFFINKEVLRYELQNPNILGYVIESYTGANLPEDNQFLQIFKEASQNHNKIFVNISQNIYKQKNSIMKQYLEKFHIYFGGDMTVQAALAKLSYLIGKGYSKEDIIEKISMNLRGELTENKTENQFQIETEGLMQAVEAVLEDYYPTSTQKSFTTILQDEIGRYISSTTTPDQFILIYKHKQLKKTSSSLSETHSTLTELVNRNNLLHIAVQHDNLPLISYFLSLQSINKDKLDEEKCSAFFYAIKSNNKSTIQFLYKQNCHVICPIDDLMNLMIAQVKKDNVDFFELLYHIEFKTSLSEIVNSERRNIAHFAALFGAERCLEMFLAKFKFQVNQKDIDGLAIEDYIAVYKKKIKINQKQQN